MTDAVAAGRRRANRLLLMVGELHKRGYQRLRIFPSIAPSGMYWRCVITPVSNIREDNGAVMASWDDESAYVTYTSGQENDYFGWGRLPASARDLTDTFLERLYPLAASGYGEDWAYAGWYVQMLGMAEQGLADSDHRRNAERVWGSGDGSRSCGCAAVVGEAGRVCPSDRRGGVSR